MENKIQVYQENEVIFLEGDQERCMYDICKGSVNIYANYGKENEKLLATLSAGQYFGEISLADRVARTASAVAAENDTQLAVVTEDNFFAYFRNDADKVLAILRNISGRLRALTKDYMEVCQAIAEAAENTRKQQEKSSILKAKLSAIVKNFIKPVFAANAIDYDMDAFMMGEMGQSKGVKEYNRGQVIIREGEKSACMYDILVGSVGVYVNYGKPSQKKLTELDRDRFFGEMGLIEQAPRSATVVALEDNTQLAVISAEGFSDYLQEKPMKVMMIMNQLCTRLRALTDDYMEACRAVVEAVDQDGNDADSGRGWLKESLVRFINEYNEAMSSIPDYQQVNYFGYHPFH